MFSIADVLTCGELYCGDPNKVEEDAAFWDDIYYTIEANIIDNSFQIVANFGTNDWYYDTDGVQTAAQAFAALNEAMREASQAGRVINDIPDRDYC